MKTDTVLLSEETHVGAALGVCDRAHWQCNGVLEKFWTPREELLRVATAEELDALAAEDQLKLLTDLGLEPYETRYTDNLLTYAGASYMWEAIKGTTLSGGSGTTLLTVYSNANAYIAVGTSATAAAAGDTALTTESARVAMDSTYPTHTDAVTSGGASIVFRITAATGVLNVHWQEWGILNASSSGRLLNHKVEDLGTKTSAASWQFTVTLTLS